jgi:hypothetical protein
VNTALAEADAVASAKALRIHANAKVDYVRSFV